MRSSTVPSALSTSTGVASRFCAQLLDDGQPVDVRQHPVGDDQVELARGGPGEALRPVGGVIDRVAALPQPFDEKPRGLGIVLDKRMCTAMHKTGCPQGASRKSACSAAAKALDAGPARPSAPRAKSAVFARGSATCGGGAHPCAGKRRVSR